MSVLDQAAGVAPQQPAAGVPMTQVADPNAMQQMQNTGVPSVDPSAASVAFDPNNIESILGIDASEVGTYEGGAAWPKGLYDFQVTGIEVKDYDIAKPDSHPRIGTKAKRIVLMLTCIGVKQMQYIDAKGAPVTPEAMQEYVGKEYQDSALFGNEGLVKQNKEYRLPMQGETPEFPGSKRMFTMSKNILGEAVYQQMEAQGAKLGQFMQALDQKKFTCIIDHNINPNDPNQRVQDQIAMFEDFIQIA